MTQYIECVFVLSHERSGSTLLRTLLDTHPKIASPSEIAVGATCEALMHFVQFSAAKGSSERALETTRKIVSDVLAEYVREKGKSIWCDKTPSNILNDGRVQLLGKIFPNAKYILLVRDCLDQVKSSLDAFAIKRSFNGMNLPFVSGRPNYVEGLVASWIDKSERLLRCKARLGDDAFLLRYEDLVVDPRATMPTLFQFLGVEDADVVDRAFKVPHDDMVGKGGGDVKIAFSKSVDSERVGSGDALREFIGDPVLIAQVADVRKRLGYVDGPRDLPASRLANQGGSGQEVDWVESYFRGKILNIEAEKLAGATARVALALTDVAQATWTLIFDGTTAKIVRGEENPTVRIKTATSALRRIINGEMTWFDAAQTGEVTLEGNYRDAVLVASLT